MYNYFTEITKQLKLKPNTTTSRYPGLRPATLLKKRLWHTCFPVNFAKFLRTPFLQNISGRLILDIIELFKDHESIQKSKLANFNYNKVFRFCIAMVEKV